jgi:hypothetical protein
LFKTLLFYLGLLTSGAEAQGAYARVDVFWNNEGKPVVSELEMIEPELWFRKSEKAADMLSNHIFNAYF